MFTGSGRSTEGQQPPHHVWIAAGHSRCEITSKLQQNRLAACLASKHCCLHLAVFKRINIQGTFVSEFSHIHSQWIQQAVGMNGYAQCMHAIKSRVCTHFDNSLFDWHSLACQRTR